MSSKSDSKDLSRLNSLNSENPINLVLGGGGALAVAHIALLEKLEKENISINAISGNSAGALVGALYCSGQGPQDILTFFKSTPIFKYTWLNPIKAGIFDSLEYEKVICNDIRSTFEELDIPLYVAATNMERNQISYFNSGSLIPRVLASCAFPIVFSPVEIEGELYSDGGILDNFPISPFQEDSHTRIGSYLGQPKPKGKSALDSTLKVAIHANDLLLYAANKHKFSKIEYVVDFPLGEFGAFDSDRIDEIYEAAQKYLEQ